MIARVPVKWSSARSPRRRGRTRCRGASRRGIYACPFWLHWSRTSRKDRFDQPEDLPLHSRPRGRADRAVDLWIPLRQAVRSWPGSQLPAAQGRRLPRTPQRPDLATGDSAGTQQSNASDLHRTGTNEHSKKALTRLFAQVRALWYQVANLNSTLKTKGPPTCTYASGRPENSAKTQHWGSATLIMRPHHPPPSGGCGRRRQGTPRRHQ
jgi:hypothetical protein